MKFLKKMRRKRTIKFLTLEVEPAALVYMN
jgi:hypothetical protein